MADIRPFAALRYSKKAGDIKDLTCPPYDIISEQQRKDYLQTNPYNVIRLELPREGEDPYKEAGDTLSRWKEEGILQMDMEPGFYVYEEAFLSQVDKGEPKSLKGLIALVRVEDFAAGVVLPHEETLSKAKTDRLNLMKATGCNFSQIYSLYQDPKHMTRQRLDRISAQPPRYDFSDGLVTHRLWVVNDPVTIEALRQDFAGRKLYIADGHHRYETAINYRNYKREQGDYCPGSEYVMMMLCDMADPGLVVFPTHRLLRDLPDFSGRELLEKCSAHFTVEPCGSQEETEEKLAAAYKENLHAFGFYDGSWTLLTLKDPAVMEEILPEKSSASQMLDVTILHSLILERHLGIDKENMANQINLTYTRSSQEAVASVDSKESCACFLLNPTRVEEIGEVAANGEKMPQKSTYFYPKLITGLVMNALDELKEDNE